MSHHFIVQNWSRRGCSLQVTGIIKRRIKGGVYLPGDPLPPLRAFSTTDWTKTPLLFGFIQPPARHYPSLGVMDWLLGHLAASAAGNRYLAQNHSRREN